MHALSTSVRRLRHHRIPHAWSTRCLHQRGPLKHLLDKGLGKFLPPEALKTVAVDFQEGLLQRVNELVRGTELESKSIAQTVIEASTKREKVLLFNYASQALNNHFFVDCLKAPPEKEPNSQEKEPNHQKDISQNLRTQIRLEYGSVAQLKSTFSAAALGMSTSGWVWFVTDAMGNTGVVPTFGPSTLLVRSRTYLAHAKDPTLAGDMLTYTEPLREEYVEEEIQEAVDEGVLTEAELQGLVDEAAEEPSSPHSAPTSHPPPPGTTPPLPASGVSGNPKTPPTPTPSNTRYLHTSPSRGVDLASTPSSPYAEVEEDEIVVTEAETTKHGGRDITQLGQAIFPLFCVSVHEHAWMSAGYGVWGKEAWLKEFWSVLDWKKVSEAYHHFVYSNPKAAEAKGRNATVQSI